MIPAHQRFANTGGWYLSPTSAHQVTTNTTTFGALESPRRRGPNCWPLRAGWPWAFDNDAFSDGFHFRTWARALILRRPYRSTCLFVAVPDVVGDAQATLTCFYTIAPMLRRRGWPVALVTQDGLTPHMVPWASIDTLFIGGTDQHKLGPEAGALIAEALRRNKWIHVGRVNSRQRLLQFWRAHSWDGTCTVHKPSHAHWIERTVKQIRAMKQQQLKLPLPTTRRSTCLS